jgi:ribose-phosphate pyrophosphokinase
VSLQVVAGTASEDVGDAIAALLGVTPAPSVVERFPDGELRPAVDDVARRCDLTTAPQPRPP